MRREAVFPLQSVGTKPNLYSFHDDLVHTSGFLGQDTGVMCTDAMTQVFAMFCHN